MTITAWGRLTAPRQAFLALNRQGIHTALQQTASGLAHGMGRSYGDVCLNPQGAVWLTRQLDRFIQFDAQTGRLVCEAGVLLKEIQQFCMPRGWGLPVTPGTQLVTVGGAIANDVHGKNHHGQGSFGDHVIALQLMRSSGEIIECSLEQQRDWLQATIGGLGLTGLILRVELQLKPMLSPYLETETVAYDDLETFFQLADESEADWEHTVAWVDCLAGAKTRGIFMRARASQHAAPVEPPTQAAMTMPFVPPFSMVNAASLCPFNTLYYHLNRRKTGLRRQHYAAYLYPLDHIRHWNRMYGPKGFYQYQSVVPRAVGMDAIQAMLQHIQAVGEGSFLAVLKTFSQRPAPGLLSFPQAGVTLALDFPNRGTTTLALLERLDRIVAEAKGRLYPAKDARMPRALFQAAYPNLPTFMQYRDPRMQSGLSRRLMD